MAGSPGRVHCGARRRAPDRIYRPHAILHRPAGPPGGGAMDDTSAIGGNPRTCVPLPARQRLGCRRQSPSEAPYVPTELTAGGVPAKSLRRRRLGKTEPANPKEKENADEAPMWLRSEEHTSELQSR